MKKKKKEVNPKYGEWWGANRHLKLRGKKAQNKVFLNKD